jgi:serine/threonine protein kinase
MATAQVFGNYELVDLLGRGGMGEVWRARHQMLERLAAVKLVRPDAFGVAAANHAKTLLRRFEREAKATSVLQSPHTIQLFDFGVTEDGTFYYAMELLQGLNFKQLVDEYGPVGANRATYLLQQVCDSLEEAHHHGLIHRDMKPANAYLCKLGLQHDFVKVLDFGLVKTVPGTAVEVSQLTTEGMAPGSPAFLAPEIVTGKVDERTDIYSLGCVAYWLLCGQLVFGGATPYEIVVGHLEKTPVPPSQRTELQIPGPLEQLVLDCLEKDPAKRPQSMKAVARGLAACPLERPWDEESAAEWWAHHRPAPPPEGIPVRERTPPPPPVAHPELSTARAEAVDALKAHFVSSHIDVAEFERRSKLATRAETPADLKKLLLDLPGPRQELVVADEPAPLVPKGHTEPQRMVTVMGPGARSGSWHVPAELNVVNVMGETTLDLREAKLGPGCSVIHCRCVMGAVKLIVPPDLYVEVEGWGFMGAFPTYYGPAEPPTGEEGWIRVTGWVVMGEIKVQPES